MSRTPTPICCALFRSSACLGALILALAALPLHAGDQPTFQFYSADGKYCKGPLLKMEADWTVKYGPNDADLLHGKDLISLRRDKATFPVPPQGPQIVLSHGDRIVLEPARSLQFQNNQFRFHPAPPVQPSDSDKVMVPVAMVALLWLQPPDGSAFSEQQFRKLILESRTQDVVLLRNNDRVEGIVVELDSQSACKVKAGKKTVQVPFDQISAVAFNSLLQLRELPKGQYGHLVLEGGGRWSLLSASVDVAKQQLVGQTLFKATVRMPLAQVAAVDLYQGRAVYLSELKPVKYEHTPFLSLTWPLVNDGNAGGDLLLLGEDAHDKGIGMHTSSRATYELGSQFKWFETLVGIDPSAGASASARVSILLDDKAVDGLNQKEVSGKSAPLAMRIPVGQSARLTLVCEGAGGGSVRGKVNWANARLLK